jgi:hypothetical protein
MWQKSTDNWLLSINRIVCHTEVYISGYKCLKMAEPMLLELAGRLSPSRSTTLVPLIQQKRFNIAGTFLILLAFAYN